MEAALREWVASVASQDLQQSLRYHVVQRLRECQSLWTVFLDSDEPTERARAQAAAARGLGAVIEVDVTRVEVSGPWAVNPDGPLVVTARVRVIRSSDGTILYARTWQDRGAHALAEWPDGTHAREEFRQQMATAYANLAHRIVADLFADAAGTNPPKDDGGLDEHY